MKKMLVVAAVAAVAFLSTTSTASAASFAQCPGVGSNPTGCQFLVTINPDGSFTTAASTTDTVPFDLVEDTLLGIQNNGPGPLLFLDLTSPIDIFGFDGDGACQPGTYNPQPACAWPRFDRVRWFCEQQFDRRRHGRDACDLQRHERYNGPRHLWTERHSLRRFRVVLARGGARRLNTLPTPRGAKLPSRRRSSSSERASSLSPVVCGRRSFHRFAPESDATGAYPCRVPFVYRFPASACF